MLGQGGFATVRLAQHKHTKQRVAIKIYQRTKLRDKNKAKAVEREIKCMQILSHPHICKLYDHFRTKKEIYLVMEYVSGISMYHYMKNKGSKPLPTETAKHFMRQIVDAVRYIHSSKDGKPPIVHRDLKLENIIVDDRNNVKIIDFGFSVFIQHGQKLRNICGTPSYMAPELCQKKEYCGFAADVWALGIILYVMLSANHPFRGANEKDLFAKISRCMYRTPETLDFEAKRLI